MTKATEDLVSQIHQIRTHAVFSFRGMLKQKECGNNLRGEDGLKKTPSACLQFHQQNLDLKRTRRLFPCVPTNGIFYKRLSRVDTCHIVGKSALVRTSGQSVPHCYHHKTKQSHTSVYLSSRDRLVFFHEKCVERLASTDQTQESWKCGKDDQSNIWQ